MQTSFQYLVIFMNPTHGNLASNHIQKIINIAHEQVWMVFIFLWNTHPIVTSKWIGHTYCIIHIHVVHMFQMLH
jgi:hypothetical protein